MWIGVDLDGTLAESQDHYSPSEIGPPVPRMVERVRGWLAAGREVRIFTARAWPPTTRVRSAAVKAVEAWCEEHLGEVIPVTCLKDPQMEVLYDDRARQVEHNTGKLL